MGGVPVIYDVVSLVRLGKAVLFGTIKSDSRGWYFHIGV